MVVDWSFTEVAYVVVCELFASTRNVQGCQFHPHSFLGAVPAGILIECEHHRSACTLSFSSLFE
jgi:hypothetical protein